MSLHHAVHAVKPVPLTETECIGLTADYYLRSVRRSDLILARRAEEARVE